MEKNTPIGIIFLILLSSCGIPTDLEISTTDTENLTTLECSDTLAQEGADILNNKLKQTYSIIEWCDLQELNISDNQLTVLPKEIGNLTNLQELDISYNKLTVLPKEIWELINLGYLDISDNPLQNLPKEIGNLIHLDVLDISNSELQSFPKEISNLINLESLNLSDNSKIIPLDKEYSYDKQNNNTLGNINIKYNNSTDKIEITFK